MKLPSWLTTRFPVVIRPMLRSSLRPAVRVDAARPNRLVATSGPSPGYASPRSASWRSARDCCGPTPAPSSTGERAIGLRLRDRERHVVVVNELRRHGFSDAEILAARLASTGRQGQFLDQFRDRVMVDKVHVSSRAVRLPARLQPQQEVVEPVQGLIVASGVLKSVMWATRQSPH